MLEQSNGIGTVSLTADEWANVIESLRYAGHCEVDENHFGLEQERAHLAAEKIAMHIGYRSLCQDCVAIAEMEQR